MQHEEKMKNAVISNFGILTKNVSFYSFLFTLHATNSSNLDF